MNARTVDVIGKTALDSCLTFVTIANSCPVIAIILARAMHIIPTTEEFTNLKQKTMLKITNMLLIQTEAFHPNTTGNVLYPVSLSAEISLRYPIKTKLV